MTAGPPLAHDRATLAGRLGPRIPGLLTQVRALVELRINCLRGAARRRAMIGLSTLPVLLAGAVALGAVMPDEPDRVRNAMLLLPSALLLFCVGAVLAVTTGGARTLLPRDEAVTMPVSPAAELMGGLLLTPLNISWLVQTMGLVVLTVWVTPSGGALAPALLLLALWVLSVSVVALGAGAAIDWVRSWTGGQYLLRASQVVALGYLAYLMATDRVLSTLDRSPTVGIATGILGGANHQYDPWRRAVIWCLVILVVGWLVAVVCTRAAHRRPPRAQVKVEAKRYPARTAPASALAMALRIDRAGVWRSAPLRRGLLALAAIPGLAAAAVRLDWPMVALLPGLVASGAGLLFGVNAFALDGTGALWRETLPGSPMVHLAARMIVVAEVCLVGSLLALAAAMMRSRDLPEPAELVALTVATVAATAQVVSHCLAWSVRHPYAASLRESRDQPAPPVAMAGYSARLAVVTTLSGLTFSGLARVDAIAAMLAFGAAIGLLAWRRLLRVARHWRDPLFRTRVIATVAGARA